MGRGRSERERQRPFAIQKACPRRCEGPTKTVAVEAVEVVKMRLGAGLANHRMGKYNNEELSDGESATEGIAARLEALSPKVSLSLSIGQAIAFLPFLSIFPRVSHLLLFSLLLSLLLFFSFVSSSSFSLIFILTLQTKQQTCTSPIPPAPQRPLLLDAAPRLATCSGVDLGD